MNINSIQVWIKKKLELTPAGRLTIAFVLGNVWTMFFFALLQDGKGKEEYIKLISDNWYTMHWAWWIIPIVLIAYLHLRNIRSFVKETLWMTIKNPAKVTHEEHDFMSRSPTTPPKHPGRPPPPPAPPKSRNVGP